MQSNTSGYWNTADGSGALTMTTTGFENTASGADALVYNSTGSENTASGFDVLYHNTIGYSNTASGVAALRNNNTGYNNTATGVNALFNDSSGYRNTGTGVDALYHTTSGHDNIALGFQAGYNINSGTNNIEIGAIGSSGDSGTIRIGNQGTQTATYVAGIFGTPMTGGDVVVNTSGRLGVLSSSARYKRDIQPLAERSKGLWQLRPVTFRYRQDPTERQYGLIAEEVANVYPELVVRGDKGEVESVQYRELIPLMLNEMQHQQNEIQHQRMTLKELKNQNQILRTALAQQTAVFTARLERLERTSQTKTLASR